MLVAENYSLPLPTLPVVCPVRLWAPPDCDSNGEVGVFTEPLQALRKPLWVSQAHREDHIHSHGTVGSGLGAMAVDGFLKG